MSDQGPPEFDVLVIGELNMDLIFDGVESFPELGKEKIASDLNITLGSSSAIFASNIARLGMKTAFCGLAGNDDFGRTIKQTLQQIKVDTRWIKLDERCQTGLTTIIRHDDDRAMITYPGAMVHFSLEHIPDEVFGSARHLHISSIFLQPGIKKELVQIIDKAKGHNMTISLDTQWDPDENWDINLQQLLPKIDFFLPNEAEFLNMTGADSVEKGLKHLQKIVKECTIVVTCSKKGATYLSNNKINTIPGHLNSTIVDTVGAGDSFNAGLIYRYLIGDHLENCVKFATITGVVSTTQAGGTGAIKSLQEVKDIAKNQLSIDDLDAFIKF